MNCYFGDYLQFLLKSRIWHFSLEISMPVWHTTIVRSNSAAPFCWPPHHWPLTLQNPTKFFRKTMNWIAFYVSLQQSSHRILIFIMSWDHFSNIVITYFNEMVLRNMDKKLVFLGNFQLLSPPWIVPLYELLMSTWYLHV